MSDNTSSQIGDVVSEKRIDLEPTLEDMILVVKADGSNVLLKLSEIEKFVKK